MRNGFTLSVRRPALVLAGIVLLYAVAWAVYVAKSAAGYDLVAYDVPLVGGHHGAWFPGSDSLVKWLRQG